MAIVWACPSSIDAYAAQGRRVEVPLVSCPTCTAIMSPWAGYWRFVRETGTSDSVPPAGPRRHVAGGKDGIDLLVVQVGDEVPLVALGRDGQHPLDQCGMLGMPEGGERLGEHLEYVWTGAIFLPGRHTIFRRKMIFGRWRPVAFFSNGPYEVRTTIVDAVLAEGRGEKQAGDHPWQQAVEPFVRLVEMATEPGELVVDPFLGSGTTGLACLATGRRFLGADVDPGAVSLALERLQGKTEESA